MHQHRVTLPRHHLLLLAVGLPEYRQVRKNHDRARNPKGDRAGDDAVWLIDDELTAIGMSFHVVLVLFGRVPTNEYGQEGEQSRRDPRVYQHDGHNAFRHIDWILERLYNSIISADNKLKNRDKSRKN